MNHVTDDHSYTLTQEILSTMENIFLAARTLNVNEKKMKNLHTGKRPPHSSGFKDFFLFLPISMVDYKISLQLLGNRQEEKNIM